MPGLSQQMPGLSHARAESAHARAESANARAESANARAELATARAESANAYQEQHCRRPQPCGLSFHRRSSLREPLVPQSWTLADDQQLQLSPQPHALSDTNSFFYRHAQQASKQTHTGHADMTAGMTLGSCMQHAQTYRLCVAAAQLGDTIMLFC